MYVLRNDPILNQRKVSIEDRKMEMIYAIKSTLKSGKLYIIEVTLGRNNLFRRKSLIWVVRLIHRSKRNFRIVSWNLVTSLFLGRGLLGSTIRGPQE